MFSTLFFLFACVVGSMAVTRTAGAFGRRAGVGCALALVGIAWLAPLGNLLALLAATGALGVARSEEQRRLAR